MATTTADLSAILPDLRAMMAKYGKSVSLSINLWLHSTDGGRPDLNFSVWDGSHNYTDATLEGVMRQAEQGRLEDLPTLILPAARPAPAATATPAPDLTWRAADDPPLRRDNDTSPTLLEFDL